MKVQLTGWEKILANHISDKTLMSRMYTELLQLSGNNRTYNSVKERAKDFHIIPKEA